LLRLNSDYQFVTCWRVSGSISKVYDVLRHGGRYSEWWPAYLVSKEIPPNRVEVVVQAKFPYKVKFVTELVAENRPHGFEIRSTGDLEGKGVWKFREVDGKTEVTFHWDVKGNKPLIRWLSPILRPFFEWNHDWVMKQGGRALRTNLRNVPCKTT
jgi:hypothetical protein